MTQARGVFSESLVTCLACWFGVAALISSPALAQVNGPGPSPGNLFDTVLNFPGDEDLLPGGFPAGTRQRIGGEPGRTTQLNVNEDGVVGSVFSALFGSEVNIRGGTVGWDFQASSGSEINISGGTVGGRFDANSGSEVNISGGIIGNGFSALQGSAVNVSGGEIGSSLFGEFNAFSSEVHIRGGRINGHLDAEDGSGVIISGGVVSRLIANSGSSVTLSGGFVGNSFRALPGSDVELVGGDFRLNGANFSGNTISLTSTSEDVFTGTLADGSSFIFSGAAFDQLTNVNLTAVALPAADLNPIVVNALVTSVPTGLRAGQTLTLQTGGSLGDDFAVVDATLNVEGGTVGEDVESFNSVVNISGGEVDETFRALSGSEVNITGGNVGPFFEASAGSKINISGGTMGALFVAESGSEVSISGGLMGDYFEAAPGSQVKISGGAFGRRFRASSGSDVELIGGEFKLNGADFSGNAITLVEGDVFTGTLADGSAFIFSHTASDELTNVTLTTVDLPAADLNPIVIDSRVESGPFGLRAGQTLTVANFGALADQTAIVDATLNLGSLGFSGYGTEVSNSVVNIRDGFLGDSFQAHAGSVINMSGGGRGVRFHALTGSVLNLYGSEFFIDGEELDNLVPGEAFTITDREMVLTGSFVDGRPFGFNFRGFFSEDVDFIAANATLTVTIALPVILGDVNLDGVVGFLDIQPFIGVLAAAGFQAEADIDQNGVVNFLDIVPFVALLSGS